MDASSRVLRVLAPGARVRVVEVAQRDGARWLRGRIAHPAGWVTLASRDAEGRSRQTLRGVGSLRWEPGSWVRRTEAGSPRRGVAGLQPTEWEWRDDHVGRDCGEEEYLDGRRLVAEMTKDVAHSRDEQPQRGRDERMDGRAIEPENMRDPTERVGHGIPVRVMDKSRVEPESDDDADDDDAATSQLAVRKKNVTTRFKKPREDDDAAPRQAELERNRSGSRLSGFLHKSFNQLVGGRRKSEGGALKGSQSVTAKADYDEQEKRRVRQQREEFAQQRKEEQLHRAKGCRRGVRVGPAELDELQSAGLALLYFIISMWGWAQWIEYRNLPEMSHYDSANEVEYNIECKDRSVITSWWFYNGLISSGAFGLWVLSEFFYWYLAPLSPGAALTTFDKGYVRSFLIVLWFLGVMEHLASGSMFMFKVDAEVCGRAAVEQAKGLIVVQWVWWPFHCCSFCGGARGDINRQALCWRRWCLRPRAFLANVDTASKASRNIDKLENWGVDFYGWTLLVRAGRQPGPAAA